MSTKIETDFTRLMGCRYPIIGAPMFLVSNVEMVVAISEAGGVGTFPALNYRPIEKYREALREMRSRTKNPIGVNVIVNKSNLRQTQDLKEALDAGVNLFITSLGSPQTVIREAKKNGAKVFCDVTNLEHALKVQDQGADGVIAVGSGAGGHAGPISPLVLVPWLKEKLKIPVIAAGGIAHGSQIAACLALGASGVHIGTRFIASPEAGVDQGYKDAVVQATPQDIVMTTKISGTPAAVINTEYIQKTGTDLHWALKILKENPRTKKYVTMLIHYLGSRGLEQAATKSSWKTVWSAGQSVGLIHEISSCEEIMQNLCAITKQVSAHFPRRFPLLKKFLPEKFDPITIAGALNNRLPEKFRSEAIRLKTLDVFLNIGIPFNRWLGMRIREFSKESVLVESPATVLRRNHVGTAHACAQALMGEYPAGLLVAQHFPIESHRMIISHLEIEYKKAGRGTLFARADAPSAWPDFVDDQVWIEMQTTITNTKKEVVSICKTRWQVKKWSNVRGKSK